MMKQKSELKNSTSRVASTNGESPLSATQGKLLGPAEDHANERAQFEAMWDGVKQADRIIAPETLFDPR